MYDTLLIILIVLIIMILLYLLTPSGYYPTILLRDFLDNMRHKRWRDKKNDES